MSGPRTRSMGVQNQPSSVRNFIKSQDGHGMNVLVHGKEGDIANLRNCVDKQFNRQAVDFTDKLCALTALEISFRPVCAELGLAAPSKGVLLDAFLTSAEFKPAVRKFFSFSEENGFLGDPKADRKRQGFLSIGTIRVVLYIISRRYSTNFQLGLCQPRGDGINFDVIVFEPFVDDTTRRVSQTRTVWLYKNNLVHDEGLGWEGVAPDGCKPISLDSSSDGQVETEATFEDMQGSPEGSRKRRYSIHGKSTPSKRLRFSPEVSPRLEPVSRSRRSQRTSQPSQKRSYKRSPEQTSDEDEIVVLPRGEWGSSPSSDCSLDDDYDDDNDDDNDEDYDNGKTAASSAHDINYIRQSARAQKQPPWEQMTDISIEELLLWLPNHVLNWPGLALLVESKGWDQAHVAKYMHNNLVATMKAESQHDVKYNTVGSKLARAVRKLPGYQSYSFSARAQYDAQNKRSWRHLLLPPKDWTTEPAELWEFFIPPEEKEIRIPAGVRGKPFTQRLYNAYCDRNGIARPYEGVPEPPILEDCEAHPLIDSPEIDTDYPPELGIKYIRQNPQPWRGGTTAIPLTIDARIPEDYDRRDIVRDFPHLVFGETFLYVHAELSHRDIVQIWRYDNEAYLKLQWPAKTESEMIKKAEAAVRKRKQIAVECLARKEEGIRGRRTKPANQTIKRVHQKFELYKTQYGKKAREVRKRLSRSELDELHRERETRRTAPGRARTYRKRNVSSLADSTIGMDGSARAAKPFLPPGEDILASDILFSGPPVRNHAPTAHLANFTPGSNIVSPANQPAPWYTGNAFSFNDPYAVPPNMSNVAFPTNLINGNQPPNMDNNADTRSASAQLDFDISNIDFSNSIWGFQDGFLRKSDPALSAIPSMNNLTNEMFAPGQPQQNIDPNLIDPALLAGSPVGSQTIRVSGGFTPSQMQNLITDMQFFPFADNQQSSSSFPPRFSFSQMAIPNSTAAGQQHQQQLPRRSTAARDSWDRLMSEVRIANDESEAFGTFTTLNLDGQKQVRRGNSLEEEVSDYAWNAFAAMPGAGSVSVDTEMRDLSME